MPITYSVDTNRSLIFETWFGVVDIEVLTLYWKAYLQDPLVMGIRRTLVDLRTSEIAFTGSELATAIEHVVLPILAGQDWKTAILVEHPDQRGIGNQYNAFADIYSIDQIFEDREKAIAWLLEQPLS